VQEPAVGLGDVTDLGRDGQQPLGQLPVDREVVRAAEEVVVHPGGVRPRLVHPGRHPRAHAAQPATVGREGSVEQCRPRRVSSTWPTTCRRASTQLAAWFEGLDLIEPGLVTLPG
jgi:hypothetical protein